MKKLNLCRQVLLMLLAIGALPFLSSCDEPSKSEKELEEKAEGAEAAKEAIKKKGEEEEKESEERKEKKEEKKSGSEAPFKASPGMKKR